MSMKNASPLSLAVQREKRRMKEAIQSIMDAYSDCDNGSKAERELDFECDFAFTPAEAERIMRKAIPGGYNEFNAEVLQHILNRKAKVFIARESSVAIYIVGTELTGREIHAMAPDEFSYDEHELTNRLWWD